MNTVLQDLKYGYAQEYVVKPPGGVVNGHAWLLPHRANPFAQGARLYAHDNQAAPKVAIISRAMAEHFWPKQNPIGERFSGDKEHPKWIAVVGVVGDVLQYGLNQTTAAPEAYMPEYQNQYSSMIALVRTAANPLGKLAELRSAVQDIDSQLPVYEPGELDEVVHESSSQQRFLALLLGLFAGLALVLAAVGIYGVIAYSVAQRTHEIGIRMALGAGWRNVMGMVLREGMGMVLAGVGTGLAGAWGLTRFLASVLYGVRPTDLITFVSVPLLLVSVSLLACYLPARRATRVDPTVALRYE
jgi:putative ABC transport system permease protein